MNIIYVLCAVLHTWRKPTYATGQVFLHWQHFYFKIQGRGNIEMSTVCHVCCWASLFTYNRGVGWDPEESETDVIQLQRFQERKNPRKHPLKNKMLQWGPHKATANVFFGVLSNPYNTFLLLSLCVCMCVHACMCVCACACVHVCKFPNHPKNPESHPKK